MALAINSSSDQRRRYDVYISFRGQDTRNSFVSHLYAALCRERITTFIDNGLMRGEDVASSLMKAIEQSKISIVIFSKSYASSSYCLDELVKILECQKSLGQVVLPVFYNIDPDEVREQSGRYGEAFSDYETQFADRRDKVLRWRAALMEASCLSGWVSGDTRPESFIVNDIVNSISKKLDGLSSNSDGLIGIDSRIKKLESLLSLESFDIRTIGIWGMGGIGKTTLAKATFNQMCGAFDTSCFLDNIREKVEKTGLHNLQKEFFGEILGAETTNAVNVSSTSIKDRLRHKRVLIVLDDVDNHEHAIPLLGRFDWFGNGSRIIVTSRDKQVLRLCEVDRIYEVQRLNNRESLQLFCFNAFKQKSPTGDYWDLSNRVTQYAMGLPLVLKVCGSHLFAKSVEEWKSTLHRWGSIPDSKVQKILQISYLGMDKDEKEIFLDIACFFRGHGMDHVKDILNGCGLHVNVGIASLVDKSLIYISDRRLGMHDLVQEMGREIVRQESISDPGCRSRLWNHEEIYHVLTNNKGTEAIKGINLDMSKIHKWYLRSDAFTSLGNLKFLKFYTPISSYHEDDSKLHASSVAYFPASLRLLHWDRYPLDSLPLNFDPVHLVELNLCYSNLELLWEGAKCLENLKRINLSYCKRLVKMLDCSLAPKLESIMLEGCSSLSEVHSSIQRLKKLAFLNLKNCIKLKYLSTTVDLASLEILDLSGCSRLNILGATSQNIKTLLLDGTAIRALPPSVQYISKLNHLNLENCKRLNTLPTGIYKLKSLKSLSLSGCSKLENFPEILEPMDNLEILRFDGTAIREVPKAREMDNLKILSFSDCNLFEIPDWFCWLSSLEHLNLRGNDFSCLPMAIKQLYQLKLLDISSCRLLHSLPELPSNIEYVNAHDCSSLESVSFPSSVQTMSLWNHPMYLFTNCFKLELSAVLNSQFIDSEGPALLPSAGIGFPGSKIPELINHQSIGSSLSVHVPWVNSRIRGFALAAVLGFKDFLDNHGFLVKCTIKLRTNPGDGISFQRDFIIFHGRPGHWSNSRILGSDHVFLSYNYDINLMESQEIDWQNESCHSTASFNFYAVDSVGRPLRGCEVRECGFSLQLDDNEYSRSCYYY